MAELHLQAAGYKLAWNAYIALKPETQQALYVGGGSMDANDWLIPFVVRIKVTKTQSNQNPETITTLAKSDFSASYVSGRRRRKSCQILDVIKSTSRPRRWFTHRVIVGVPPPHSHDDLVGPEWLLSVTVKQGQLSDIQIVPVTGDEP